MHRARLGVRLLSGSILALTLSLACSASALANRRVEISYSCNAVTFTFSSFPAGKEDTVGELIRIDHIVISKEKFTFEGPNGSNSVPVSVPAGRHVLKAEAIWNTNGFHGESGQHAERLECSTAVPAFTIEKLQAIAGSGRPFTATPLTAKAGQTVDYEILVSNTGKVPLSLTFTDSNCDPETIGGGPGEAALAPGASTTYTCDHVLVSEASYSNDATVTAEPFTHTSNTVVTNVIAKPRFEVRKLQEIAGSATGYAASALTASVGDVVNYEIVVNNVGDVPLMFKEFTDVYCDAGTIMGGPEGSLAAGHEAAYTCSRRLTEVGSYLNVASVTATAAGFEKVEATNTVTVSATPAPSAPSGALSGTQTPPLTGSGVAPATGGVLSSKGAARRKKVHRVVSHRKPRFTG